MKKCLFLLLIVCVGWLEAAPYKNIVTLRTYYTIGGNYEVVDNPENNVVNPQNYKSDRDSAFGMGGFGIDFQLQDFFYLGFDADWIMGVRKGQDWTVEGTNLVAVGPTVRLSWQPLKFLELYARGGPFLAMGYVRIVTPSFIYWSNFGVGWGGKLAPGIRLGEDFGVFFEPMVEWHTYQTDTKALRVTRVTVTDMSTVLVFGLVWGTNN